METETCLNEIDTLRWCAIRLILRTPFHQQEPQYYKIEEKNNTRRVWNRSIKKTTRAIKPKNKNRKKPILQDLPKVQRGFVKILSRSTKRKIVHDQVLL